jgi:hypothetical protein
VFKYWPEQPFVEIHAESLLAKPGDRFSNFPFGGSTGCGAASWMIVLGKETVVRGFSHYVDNHYQLAYGIGPVEGYDVVDWDYESRLVYAKIGSQTYGTRVSVDENHAETPTGFQLDQNYPNPFNPSTTIEYTVAGVGIQASGVSRVRLAVYDMLGREVAVLVDEQKAPGRYSAVFDAAGLPTGVYVYRLQAGDYVEAKRLVVVR